MFRLRPKPRRTDGSAFCHTKCGSCDYNPHRRCACSPHPPRDAKAAKGRGGSGRRPARLMMPRSKRNRAVRAVVGLLAALASAAENFARFSAALGAIDIRRREPAKRQPYQIARIRSLVVRATWHVWPSCALEVRLTANDADRVNAMLFARNARVALKAMMGFQGVC